METKWEQEAKKRDMNGNKVGTRTEWEKNGNKVGQEWEQSGNKNPKVAKE